jgi:hypothetical protein
MARRAVLALGALALLVASSPASAQKAEQRQGLHISLGLGSGSVGLSCDDCSGIDRENSTSGYLNISTAIRPNLTVGGEISGWTKSEDGADGTVSSFMAVAHYYPMARQNVFVSGGLGLTRMSMDDGSGEMKNNALGLQIGAGYDWRVARNFALTPYAQWVKGMQADVKVDGTSSGVKMGADVFQFGLGLTWNR